MDYPTSLCRCCDNGMNNINNSKLSIADERRRQILLRKFAGLDALFDPGGFGPRLLGGGSVDGCLVG
ncbi:MAG: hypothetical protein Q7U45_06545, partial [Burkholderiaceae bacterium]|nr:hypothetical protein [Burkholderiaceae bacterium]